MNSHSFQSYVQVSMIINTIIILSTFVEVALSVDNRFEACKPQNCGKGPNIRYPFWIQENYCGYPEFRVTCRNNEPILYASGNDYIIRDIFYANQSFRLGIPPTVRNRDEASCTAAPSKNRTLDDQSPFHFGPNVEYLSFFLNCTSKLPEEFDNLTILPVNLTCPTPSSGLLSFAVFVPRGYLSDKSTTCQYMIRVPVEPGNTDGFTVEWDKRRYCDDVCPENDGYCGFDDGEEELVCFCGGSTDQSSRQRCKNSPLLFLPEKSKSRGKTLIDGVEYFRLIKYGLL